ncbi:MAG: hypothetical protein D5R97_06025 [Candidatus Syntrophonatronum acetioxidans]|uniref:Uncharacterized protein n=1 Tax=Candidatus Syntrophonatronum acetioxidans TaxID=1795816 RepID=A0A424YDX6_9FIRM|nr:MAG: hypothetical protein D5R97_06025 [Candidatus Syntrophonatronum acetioxidans]
MIIYSAMPLELILEGSSDFSPEYLELEAGGLKLLVEKYDNQQGKVVRLISSNPHDYLNPLLQPGEIIKL